MKLKPSENTKLYGMNHFFNEITNLFNEKKMPNKILLTGKKGLGKSTMAYHIVNYILSINEDYSYDTKKFTINDKNRSFKLIQNNSHPNFYNLWAHYLRIKKENFRQDLINCSKVIERLETQNDITRIKIYSEEEISCNVIFGSKIFKSRFC